MTDATKPNKPNSLIITILADYRVAKHGQEATSKNGVKRLKAGEQTRGKIVISETEAEHETAEDETEISGGVRAEEAVPQQLINPAPAEPNAS